jgi:hypothetical protein
MFLIPATIPATKPSMIFGNMKVITGTVVSFGFTDRAAGLVIIELVPEF